MTSREAFARIMTRLSDELILVASIILFSATFSAARFRDTLNITLPLYDGETLVSAGGTFALGFFSPNISSDKRYVAVWYYDIPTHDIVWVANGRCPVHGFNGSLTLSPNGTLFVVDRRNSSAISWSSLSTRNTIAAVTNPVAQLLDTGNLIVRDAAAGGNYVWQSFDYPSNTLLPGMFLGQDLRTGLNHTLTSWTSATDPSPGDYTTTILLSSVPQLAVTLGPDHSVYWRAGPWMGDGFTGNADIPTYKHLINITFLTTSERVGYYYEPVGDIMSRLTANPNGMAEQIVWLDPPGRWNDLTRRVQCDVLSLCGPFGICNANGYPFFCSCLPGFRPKIPARWKQKNGTDGCVRNTMLDCVRNGTSTDGFVTVSGMKLPDTSAAASEYIGLDECRASCLRNCSCTGYSLAEFTGGGSGCIMWTGELTDMRLYSSGGEELHVRLAAADVVKSTASGHSDHKGRTIASIVGSIAGILLVGSVLIGCLLIHHSKRKNRTRRLNGEEMASESDIDLPLFDFETIAEATNNFSEENRLGEGGFGPVYKGNIDGKEIAVKRLSKSSTQGLHEFKNEVTLIAKLHHRNLVLLLGCCIQRQERMLIYEYLSNRSLDIFLFDKRKKGLLNWQLRYRIILGIARGILYLHQDSMLRVIHRDLKASNILLNEEMMPKVSDFGLARIFGTEEANSKTKRVVGTYGYMSPEYAMDGIFSVKSDVFSFGVIVLEVISCQKNRGNFFAQSNHLVGQAWSLWKEGNALQLLDESIGNSFSLSEVLKCIKVGLLCVQEYPEDRPLMSSVILMLTSDKEVIPEPKRSGFVARRPFEADQSPSGKQEPLSMNELTLTMPYGR